MIEQKMSTAQDRQFAYIVSSKQEIKKVEKNRINIIHDQMILLHAKMTQYDPSTKV